jgi:hypothetical protein
VGKNAARTEAPQKLSHQMNPNELPFPGLLELFADAPLDMSNVPFQQNQRLRRQGEIH